MNSITARVSVVAALTTMAAAQVNPFVVYPQDPERQNITCTSFVGRPDWNNAAEALFEIDQQHFRSVGDANGFMRVFGVYHWVADERLSTSETYGLVIRLPAATAGPDMTTTGEVLRIPNLTTPPSTNTARGTWIMHDGFNIAGGQIIPGDYFLGTMLPRIYIGIDLPANSLWPNTDGHSLFRADMLNANTGAVFGENHSAAAHDPTWAGLQNAPSFSTPWTYILGPFVTTPNLHVGGVDPSSTRLGAPGANFGMNGLYPDISGLPTTNPRSDGIVLRMTDNLAPFGLAMFGASLGWQFPYYHGPIFSNLSLIGYSHIGDGSQTVTIALSTLQNGVREINFALPGTIPAVFVGTEIVFQGISWDTNTNQAEWTNAQMAHF
ncbi:MAG: hypothetical protein KDC48_07755 [Planctomycetes bacterium]|nr:hypothetical protein [Planctomycetota bacterium]